MTNPCGAPRRPLRNTLGLLAVAALALMGCGKSGRGAPEAVSAEQAAANLKTGFQGAAPELQKEADQLGQSLSSGNLTEAYGHARGLTANPDLTRDQREAATRSMVTVMQKLQQAAASGDKQAQDTLEAHRASK
jgi:hypothetical protein